MDLAINEELYERRSRRRALVNMFVGDRARLRLKQRNDDGQLVHHSVAKLVVVEYISEYVGLEMVVFLLLDLFAFHFDLGGIDLVDVCLEVAGGYIGQLDDFLLSLDPAFGAGGFEELGLRTD